NQLCGFELKFRRKMFTHEVTYRVGEVRISPPIRWPVSVCHYNIATYPWAVSHEKQDINLADYPAVQRWFNETRTRPAVERAWRRANG
ncbi:MAG: hypothetical protein ACR5LH_14770, partial [Sodalis sp. (in: enterobacteria)]